jgi:hypothetical protein
MLVDWRAKMKRLCKAYAFQLECGEEKKKYHVQAVFEFKSACTLSAAKKKLQSDVFKPPHLEQCRSWVKAIEYCMKEDTRALGMEPEHFNVPLPKKKVSWEDGHRDIDPLHDRDLYSYQLDMDTVIRETPIHDRRVYWIWEREGGVGKSAYIKHLCCLDPCIVRVSGAGKDVKYLLGQMGATDPKSGKPLGPGYAHTVLWDLPRSFDSKYLSWDTVECVKNGHWTSGKYESKSVLQPVPRVIIFSNEPPDLSKLSADRWEVLEIESVRTTYHPTGRDFRFTRNPTAITELRERQDISNRVATFVDDMDLDGGEEEVPGTPGAMDPSSEEDEATHEPVELPQARKRVRFDIPPVSAFEE